MSETPFLDAAITAVVLIAFALSAIRALVRPSVTQRARLERAAAAVTLAFLLYYVVNRTVHGWTGPALRDGLIAQLSATWHGLPVQASLYLVGIAATATHLAISLRSRARGARARVWASHATGVLLFVVGANMVLFFATGTRLFTHAPLTLDGVQPHPPCPPSQSVESK